MQHFVKHSKHDYTTITKITHGGDEQKQLLLDLGGNACHINNCEIFNTYNIVTSGTGACATCLRDKSVQYMCSECKLRYSKTPDQDHQCIDVYGNWEDPQFWLNLRDFISKKYGKTEFDIVQFPLATTKFILDADDVIKAIVDNIFRILKPGGFFYFPMYIDPVDYSAAHWVGLRDKYIKAHKMLSIPEGILAKFELHRVEKYDKEFDDLITNNSPPPRMAIVLRNAIAALRYTVIDWSQTPLGAGENKNIKYIKQFPFLVGYLYGVFIKPNV